MVKTTADQLPPLNDNQQQLLDSISTSEGKESVIAILNFVDAAFNSAVYVPHLAKLFGSEAYTFQQLFKVVHTIYREQESQSPGFSEGIVTTN